MALPTRTAPEGFQWIAVDSSWIARIGWKPLPGTTYGTLLLEAKKGSGVQGYQYVGVPRFVWSQFQAAPSKGKAWHALLKGRYAESRIG